MQEESKRPAHHETLLVRLAFTQYEYLPVDEVSAGLRAGGGRAQ